MISHEKLKSRLHYDPDTGLFTHLQSKGCRKASDIAGCANRYWIIAIDGKKYPAHRLAWLYVHGAFPNAEIDHIDGNKMNNAIVNLRVANDSQNGANRKHPQRNNKSGLKGAYLKSNGRWYSDLRVNGKKKFLGYFDTAEDAHRSYCIAHAAAFGEFSPHNRRAA